MLRPATGSVATRPTATVTRFTPLITLWDMGAAASIVVDTVAVVAAAARGSARLRRSRRGLLGRDICLTLPVGIRVTLRVRWTSAACLSSAMKPVQKPRPDRRRAGKVLRRLLRRPRLPSLWPKVRGRK